MSVTPNINAEKIEGSINLESRNSLPAIVATGDTNDGSTYVFELKDSSNSIVAKVDTNGKTTLYDDLIVGNSIITTLGGKGSRFTSGEALYEGEVVTVLISGGANSTVVKVPTTGAVHSMPYGVVYKDVAGDAPVWIITDGIAYVLPEAGITAARGNVCVTSPNTAGRVVQYSTVPTSDHWDEIGHFIANGTGNGAKTLAVIHQN